MGREKIFIDLGGGAPKTPIFYAKNDSNSKFHCLRPLRRRCWMACGPLTLRNVQGSWGHGPVHEYGPRCARRALALRPLYRRGAAPLFTAPRPSAQPRRASSPRTSGSVTAEYARSPYQTPHLAGASASGWSTLTGGSEHVAARTCSSTPRLHDSTTQSTHRRRRDYLGPKTTHPEDHTQY